LRLFAHNLKVREVGARDDCESARAAVELSQSRRLLDLALSHDGLRVFANRILANRIFADRVLADWRRRYRGWLPARQIGGSGNAMAPDYLSLRRWIGSNAIGRSLPTMGIWLICVLPDQFIATFFYRSAAPALI